MALITISGGGNDIADGNYDMTLISITPKTIVPKVGDNAGKETPVLEWTFVDSEDDGVTINGLTSVIFTPKSKAVAWITAILGPDAARVGASFDERDLIGRKAMVSVKVDTNGYPKIDAVTPMPVRRSARAAALPSVDGEQDNLPF